MNNKKVIIAIALLFGICFVFSLTFAYSTDESVLENKFKLGEWKTVYTEEFESPSNWVTCETIDKTITVKNESDTDVAVRIKLEEQWLSKDNEPLSLYSNASDVRMAQINMANTDKWEKRGAYYYYNINLRANETAVTPISGVTLNCDANLNDDVDYAGGTYRLKATAQTIQASQKDEWTANLLYDATAAKTRGVDMAKGVNFAKAPQHLVYGGAGTTTADNGVGVITYHRTASSTHPVYYYRGDVNDNFVIWRNYCWRIVRTTTSGGTKIIYSGTVSNNTCAEMGSYIADEVSFNSGGGHYGVAETGYMFEEGQSAKNTNDSVIKKEVDKWFKNNIILGEDDLEDTVFCNDRSMYRDPYMSGYYRLTKSYSIDTYYSTYGTYAPSLDCANEVDRFTRDKANGNGDLTFPIALITADEATMAGACWSSCSEDIPNDTQYISYLTKSNHQYRNYYTMTPEQQNYLFSIRTGRDGLWYDWFSNKQVVRPVVSLKADTRYTSGDGTAANPYIVEK